MDKGSTDTSLKRKWPWIDEQIKQLWDIYTMEYYSAVKKRRKFTFCDNVDGHEEHYAK